MNEESKQPYDEIVTDSKKTSEMKYELKCPCCKKHTLVDPHGYMESGFTDGTGKMIPSGGKWWPYRCTNPECGKTAAIPDDLYTKI